MIEVTVVIGSRDKRSSNQLPVVRRVSFGVVFAEDERVAAGFCVLNSPEQSQDGNAED